MTPEEAEELMKPLTRLWEAARKLLSRVGPAHPEEPEQPETPQDSDR